MSAILGQPERTRVRPEGTRGQPEGTRGQVLVVDGEAGARESLRMLLEPLHAVTTAATACEAREQIAHGPVDVVTLDLRLPDARGEDLLLELRDRHPEIGVVVITGRASVAAAALAVRAGAIDFLEKPFDLAEVRSAVSRALARALSRRCAPDPAGFLAALAATIEAQHPFLAGHARRTALYAGLLVERLGLPAEQCEHVRVAALLHDVGKIGIPTRLLMRPQALTGAERSRIEQHSEIGARLVAPLGLAPAVAGGVRHHHERWDGDGYPGRLAGEAIPVTARIVALADAWDAMSSDRPYRRGMASERVRAEVERCAGSQFDPVLAKEFLALFEAAEVEPELLADALAVAAGPGASSRGGVNRW